MTDRPKYYQIPKDEWHLAATLGEVIVKLVRDKQTQSEEFQAILRVWGKDKVKQMYKDQIEIDKKKS